MKDEYSMAFVVIQDKRVPITVFWKIVLRY